jgi:GrpB-like predicted nucleotidyltransferase (UPF0157 family)
VKYSFHPYHKYYQSRAQTEIIFLKKKFPFATIEHFGSTAVPGLGGKGIIDISMSVKKSYFKSTQEQLSKIDYIFSLTGGVINERHFFRKLIKYSDGHKQFFHLHLTKKDNINMRECLMFRDFLRQNPELAQKYSDIKKMAVVEAKKYYRKVDKKKAYMEIKKPIIEEILQRMKNKF